MKKFFCTPILFFFLAAVTAAITGEEIEVGEIFKVISLREGDILKIDLVPLRSDRGQLEVWSPFISGDRGTSVVERHGKTMEGATIFSTPLREWQLNNSPPWDGIHILSTGGNYRIFFIRWELSPIPRDLTFVFKKIEFYPHASVKCRGVEATRGHCVEDALLIRELCDQKFYFRDGRLQEPSPTAVVPKSKKVGTWAGIKK